MHSIPEISTPFQNGPRIKGKDRKINILGTAICILVPSTLHIFSCLIVTSNFDNNIIKAIYQMTYQSLENLSNLPNIAPQIK